MRFKNFESYANENREMKLPADVLLISDLFEINKENFTESQRRLNVGRLFSNSFQTELSNEAGQ